MALIGADCRANGEQARIHGLATGDQSAGDKAPIYLSSPNANMRSCSGLTKSLSCEHRRSVSNRPPVFGWNNSRHVSDRLAPEPRRLHFLHACRESCFVVGRVARGTKVRSECYSEALVEEAQQRLMKEKRPVSFYRSYLCNVVLTVQQQQ